MKISIACGQCGKQYQLKPELAGKKVKCQDCGTTIRIPNGGAPQGDAPAKQASSKTKSPVKSSAKAAAAPAAKKAAVAPAETAAPEAPRHSILDEAMAGAARLPTAGEMFCPKCKMIMPSTSVFCVGCGLDLQSGRNTRVASEANRPKRKPGQMPVLGIFVAIVAIFYGLAGGVFFALCMVGSILVLMKLGLPTGEDGQSSMAMFGIPVHILLSLAGLLMSVSGIGIFRYTKGATLNAGLGAKIYVWTLVALLCLSVGNVFYKTTARYKEAEEKAAAAASGKELPAPPDLGRAQALTASNLQGIVRMDMLATIVGVFALLLGPPVFVWAWAATQGRKWDWELPEPVHKIKHKPQAKVGGPQPAAEKK